MCISAETFVKTPYFLTDAAAVIMFMKTGEQSLCLKLLLDSALLDATDRSDCQSDI